MEKMVIPLIDTEICPETGVPSARDGQLRSDLIRLIGAQADRCRIRRERIQEFSLSSQGFTEAKADEKTIQALSENRSGVWNFDAAELYREDDILLSVSNGGTSLIIFHADNKDLTELRKVILSYPEVRQVEAYAMPEEVFGVCVPLE